MPEITSPTRDTLLDAAEQLFAERGYAAVGTREIAERACANIASIKYHFGSKSELYLETVRRCMGKADATAVWELLRPVPADQASAASVLARFIHEMLRRHLQAEQHTCCNFMLREAMEPSEAIDAVVRDYIEPYQRMLVEVVRAVAPDRGEEDLALSASSVMGQVLHYRVFRPFIERMPGAAQPLGDEARISRIAAHITRFSLAGLGCAESVINQAVEQVINSGAAAASRDNAQ